MLVGGRDCWTQIWMGITYGQFHQTLVSSGKVVSDENIFVSNCVRTDDRRKVMTKAHMTLWGQVSKEKKGGAYYFLSVVKSKKNAWLQQ